jgi:hypothetical protein
VTTTMTPMTTMTTMTVARPPPLSASESERLLHQLVLEQLTEAMSEDTLSGLERRIALSLARLGESDDTRMLACARRLVAHALRQLADACEHPSPLDDRDLDVRYENAICREVVAALDEAKALEAAASAASSPPQR